MRNCGVALFSLSLESSILRVLDRKEPMPQFGFTKPWSWLSYKVGWPFGVGVTRAKTVSVGTKSDWVFRSVALCVLVGAEGWLCLSRLLKSDYSGLQ